MSNYRVNFVYPAVMSIEINADSPEDAETKGWKKLEEMWNDDHDFVFIIDQLKNAAGAVAFEDIKLDDVEEA